jgi:ring-1,2-phenylacetyl-CoA epoxidase subunit PaaD
VVSLNTRYPSSGFDVHAVERARLIASSVPDPEIPVVTIAELGILRSVLWNEADRVIDVTITPTYSGCPAMGQIEDDLRMKLDAAGALNTRIVTTLAPAWTTDWMTQSARDKLRDYGITPPCTASPSSAVISLSSWRKSVDVPCPRCHSTNTTETSRFGSTACKALYKCLACEEPFDYFKPY